MNRCPITYAASGDKKYSDAGLRKLSPKLTVLNDFPYSAEEQVRESVARASKMSIQGVQPKLSARLNLKQCTFEIVDLGGNYIIKPQTPNYSEVPENEDLTMRLAGMIGIEIPLHGLFYSIDGSMVRRLYGRLEDKMIKWDMKAVATPYVAEGVYIAVIEAITDEGHIERKIIKLARVLEKAPETY